MAKRSFKKAVRSKNDGDRYPCGKLKPPAPNAKVVAMRRAVLGAKPGEIVDLSRAENALDVALVRGWISERQHQAAQTYATLIRVEMGRLPVLRVGQLQETAAPAALRLNEEGLNRSGVITEADAELFRAGAKMDAGQITPREYALAERRHRVAKIDWSRVPSADIAKLFDALMDSTPAGPIQGSAGGVGDEAVSESRLRSLWTWMTPANARALFDVAVLGLWPAWIVALVNGLPLNRLESAGRAMLLRALDTAADNFSARQRG